MRKKNVTQDVYRGVKQGLKTSSISEQTVATGLSYQTVLRIKKSTSYKNYKEIVKSQHQKYEPGIYYIEEHDLPRRSLWDKLKSLFS